jgi:CO/xanthine dehydrogenase Mo-binding subunit
MTTTTTTSRPAIGAAAFASDEVRIEGHDKVSGQQKYTADMSHPDMLWAAFATSPVAHAKIVSIDTTAAKAVPGVIAVLTSADLPPGKRSGRMLYDLPVLAYEKVVYIGDRVAAVAAETREAAEAAARLVEVEYEELPALLDVRAALAPDAPVIHPDRDSYFYAGKTPPLRPHPNTQGSTRIVKGSGDLAAIFAGAAHVFEQTFTTPRQHAGYMEPHATFVWIDAEGVVHVYTPNKQPFSVHRWLSNVIDVPPEKIIVEPCAIGGDFGGKGLTIDEFVCYYLARATGRPVKYVWTYLNELQASSVRHAAEITLRTAVDANGKFLAHHSVVVFDGGAYAAGKPAPNLLPGGGYSTVPYAIPDALIEVSSVYTNTIPGAHVRAPADVQIFFAWEQHVDIIARELGIDALELRMLNVVRDGEPALSTEHLYRPNAVGVLDALKRDFEARPKRGGVGRGFALVCRHTGGGATAIDVTLSADGAIEVVCGVPDQGAGIFTALRRIMGTTLGIDEARIRVRRGSTREAKNDPGSGGSRVTHIVGQAAVIACDALVAEIKHRTGATFDDDATFARLAAQAARDGAITVTGAFDATTHDEAHPADFSFSAFAFDVVVDRETGAYRLDDALLVADVGRIINPIGHQGQLDGGFVYGIGSSTMEEMPIDESGKVTTLSLGEYKVPTMMDIPPLRTILVESPAQGPYGAKMAGELSNSGVAPGLANAIYDAVGVRLTAFPITSERIYAALGAGNAEPA